MKQTGTKGDQSLNFLNHFVRLYEELLSHSGYGDIDVHIRNIGPKCREVIVRSGKEYRFSVKPVTCDGSKPRYRVVETSLRHAHSSRNSEWRAMPLHAGSIKTTIQGS